MTNPTVDELKSTIEEVNIGEWEAPGLDGMPVELLRYGRDRGSIYSRCIAKWSCSSLGREFMRSFYKGKGSKSNCRDYRGIYKLARAAGKVFSKVLSTDW